MPKQKILMAHTSHLDLFWFAGQPECLEIGRKIIEDAVNFCREDKGFHFVIESVRFAEYFVLKNPEMADDLKKFIAEGRIEVSGTYIDRHEFFFDGESYVRNVTYAKRMLQKMFDYDSRFSFHPDLPGFSPQTPQIHKKAGLDVYFQTRGFGRGTRVKWAALDGTDIVFFNFPGGYGGADVVHFVYPNIEEIKKNLQMEDVMLCMGASDCGRAGTSHSKINGEEKGGRHDLKDIIDYANRTVDVECSLASPCATVLAQDNSNLPVMKGEAPSRWGMNGAANQVKLFQRDKQVSAVLCDGEKLYAITKRLGLDITESARPGYHSVFNLFIAWRRRYFDKYLFEGDKKNTATINEWFDFAWRMLMTTHDHNYAGCEAAQTEFDRFMYQTVGERIGERTVAAGLKALCTKMDAKAGSIAVFNTLNWERTELVEVDKELVEPGKQYAAYDSGGKASPVFVQGGRYMFAAEGLPSIGYKTYVIKESAAVPAERTSFVSHEGAKIVLENKYYSLTVNAVTGVLEQIIDRETGFTFDGDFMHIRAYADPGGSVNEKYIENWEVLEDAADNVAWVKVISDNPHMTVLRVKSEMFKSNLEIDFELYHNEKRFDVRPKLYNAGLKRLKLCMTLPHIDGFNDKYYGVPYGAQKFGEYFVDPATYKGGGDEIGEELYRRYRDIHYWMANEDGNHGYSIATINGPVDYRPDSTQAVLMRCMTSMDSSWQYTNYGEQSWYFSFYSYKGSWENQNEVWRRAWELLHPAYTAVLAEDGDASLPASNSFIGTGGAGIVTVYKVSDFDSDAYTLRMINPCSIAAPVKLTGSIGKDAKWECRNINETPCSDPVDKLGSYEIKTLVSK